MAARSDSKVPWFPLVILLLGIVLFWIVPLAQGESTLTVVSASKK